MKRLIAAALALGFLGACDLTGTRTRLQRPGQLRLAFEDSITFVVPDTVVINTDFQISVETFGGGCDSKGPTDVLNAVDGSAQLRPFDITDADADRLCPAIVQTFQHSGTLRFNTAGTTSVTVVGRDWDGASMFRTHSVVVK